MELAATNENNLRDNNTYFFLNCLSALFTVRFVSRNHVVHTIIYMLFSCGLVAAAMATSQIIANARFDYCSAVDVMIYLRYRIQSVEGPVLDPCAKETCLKRGQKVDPLEIKSGPPWRVQFWPLHCGKYVEAFISS